MYKAYNNATQSIYDGAALPAESPSIDLSQHEFNGYGEIEIRAVTFNSEAPDFVQTAIYLLKAGNVPIPLRPRSDRPSVGWYEWVTRLSIKAIRAHWRKNPTHELGYLAWSGRKNASPNLVSLPNLRSEPQEVLQHLLESPWL